MHQIDSFKNMDLQLTLKMLDEVNPLIQKIPEEQRTIDYYKIRSQTLRALADYEEGQEASTSLLEVSERLKDTLGIATAYSGFSVYHQSRNEDSIAQVWLQKIITITEKNDSRIKERAFAHQAIGELLLYTDPPQAISQFLAAEKLFDKFEFPALKGSVYYKLAIIYKQQSKYEKCIEMAERSIDYFNPSGRYIFQSYDMLGKTYGKIKDMKNARKYYNKMFDHPYLDKRHSAIAYNSYGLTLKENNFLEEAKQQLRLGINLIQDEPKLKNKYAQLLGNYGTILFEQEKYAESILQFKKAKEILLEDANSSLANKKLILQMYLSALTKTKDHSQLNEDFEQFVSLSDSTIKITKNAIDEEMIEKYRSELKEAENEQLIAEQALKEEQISKQQKILYGGFSTLIVFSILSAIFYRQREKQKQLNTELTSQRDQIKILNRELNHRVKNNLAFMTSLLEMQGRRTDSDETKQVLRESESRLKALSIVHNNLFQNDTHTTINLKSYLLEIVQHLQNIFETPGKSLQIETQLADIDFDAEDAMRVGLVVNELVTNSVKHAFADIDAPKIILETAKNTNGKILLRYKDNGPGFVQKELQEATTKSGSIGVKLIQLLEQQLAAKLDLQVS